MWERSDEVMNTTLNCHIRTFRTRFRKAPRPMFQNFLKQNRDRTVFKYVILRQNQDKTGPDLVGQTRLD